MQNKLKTGFRLFMYFFRIGWFTFGGGWSIVAQVQRDFAEKRCEIKAEELLDIVSVGRSMPGTMIGNVAYLFGYHMGGWFSGFMSVMGIALPPMIILTAITFCYTAVSENVYVARALAGVRASVAPIILSAALRLHKGAFPKWYYIVIALVACALSLIFKVSSILIIVLGILAGLILNYRKESDGK